MAQLKRFGGWKSSTAAERYIDVSDAGKTHAAVALSQSSLRSFPSNGVLVVGGSGRDENRKLEVTTTSNTVDDTAVGIVHNESAERMFDSAAVFGAHNVFNSCTIHVTMSSTK